MHHPSFRMPSRSSKQMMLPRAKTPGRRKPKSFATHFHMKAAAVLLVGWYLMGPPVSGNWWNQATLSGWKIIDSYDTAKECGKARADHAAAKPITGVPRSDPLYGAQLLPEPEVCVASDDPRLKLPWLTH